MPGPDRQARPGPMVPGGSGRRTAVATVHVSVSSGVATVDGVLRRRRQMDSVSRIVSALPGVVGVRNNLRYVIDDVRR